MNSELKPDFSTWTKTSATASSSNDALRAGWLLFLLLCAGAGRSLRRLCTVTWTGSGVAVIALVVLLSPAQWAVQVLKTMALDAGMLGSVVVFACLTCRVNVRRTPVWRGGGIPDEPGIGPLRGQPPILDPTRSCSNGTWEALAPMALGTLAKIMSRPRMPWA